MKDIACYVHAELVSPFNFLWDQANLLTDEDNSQPTHRSLPLTRHIFSLPNKLEKVPMFHLKEEK